MFASTNPARTVDWRKAFAALLAGAVALTASAEASADGWKRKHRHHHHYYERDYVIVKPVRRGPPRTIYVVPEPVVVYPPPYTYGPSYPPSVNFNFSLPMR